MNGVIWSKTQETFLPISSVPAYAAMQQERLRQTRELETHNFQLRNLTLTSFKEKSFFEFYDDDTKVTGFCGDVWTLLSQVLNFTLQPVKADVNSIGIIKETNLSYQTGLLGIIFRNETDAIPKLEAYSSRLNAIDFTMPLWMSGHGIYIRYNIVHDSMWMTKAFSWEVWCITFSMYILLSICSFWSQILLKQIGDKYKSMVFGEHLFHNFGMLCNQSHISHILNGRSKILEVSLGLFCSILLMAYGALLFIYMTKKVFVPPFNDIGSLVNNTGYKIITLNGSIEDMIFKLVKDGSLGMLSKTGRLVSVSTIDEIYKLICSTQRENYAIFQAEEQYYVKGRGICSLKSAGEIFMKMWITSGLAKNFKYKRSIDLGILRLMESGLLKTIRNRWLIQENEINFNTPEAIGIDQVLFIITMMCCGVVAASVILMIEKVVYAYKFKMSQSFFY